MDRLFSEGMDGIRIFLDHGKELCRTMVQNVRKAADRCSQLIPIILEQRSTDVSTSHRHKAHIGENCPRTHSRHTRDGNHDLLERSAGSGEAGNSSNARHPRPGKQNTRRAEHDNYKCAAFYAAPDNAEVGTLMMASCVVLFDMGKSSAVVTSVQEHCLKCTFRCAGILYDNTVVHM